MESKRQRVSITRLPIYTSEPKAAAVPDPDPYKLDEREFSLLLAAARHYINDELRAKPDETPRQRRQRGINRHLLNTAINNSEPHKNTAE